MIKGWRWTGAAFEPVDSLPLADRGFRYGMAVFETVALHAGRALFFHEHLLRLGEACAAAGFPALPELVEQALPADLQGVTGTARLYVTAGAGGYDEPVAGASLYLLAEPREAMPFPPGGFRLAPAPQPHLPPLPGQKSACYWGNILARERARHAGFDEALLAAPDSREIISASMANLFAVHRGRVSTPRPASGCRRGVVREWVGQQLEVEEAELQLEDLADADEMFLTNSWIGVMPVSALGQHRLEPGRVAAGLARSYHQLLQ